LYSYKHLKKYVHKDLKISEKLGVEVVSLPVHPALIKQDLEKIVEVVNGAFQHPCK
jgi:dTDP-4-amino-4,6-dideoxygalactose transaminase